MVRNDCCDTAQSDKVTKVAAAKKSSNWNFPTISTASGNVCRSLRKSVFFSEQQSMLASGRMFCATY